MTWVCTCGTSGEGVAAALDQCPTDGITFPAMCVETEHAAMMLVETANAVTGEQIGYIYVWGVSAVLIPFVIGYVVGCIKRLISLT